MRRLAVAPAAAGVLAASPAAALAATPPPTGSFAVEGQFTVQPGDTASCSLPVAFDPQVRGTDQLFLNAQGQPVRLLLHEHWTGTGTANGKYVIEHAAPNGTVDLISGANSTTGHDQVPFGGVVIHDSGQLASTPTATSPSKPARTRDSTATPQRSANSARHGPDLKAGRAAKEKKGQSRASVTTSIQRTWKGTKKMRIPRFRTIIGLISGPVLIAGGLATLTLASAGPAAAGQPVTQTLTPPPPSFETCKTAGNGFICDGARTESYGPDDTAIACGSGASAFDIFDQGTHNQHAIRFYDTAGDLTRRVIYDQYFSRFSNPLTSAAVPYTQHNTTTDVLATPGDLASATETTTGEFNFTVPHMGAVFLNAGRTVFGADGTLEFSAGPQQGLDYFYNGNTAAVAELCTALGAS